MSRSSHFVSGDLKSFVYAQLDSQRERGFLTKLFKSPETKWSPCDKGLLPNSFASRIVCLTRGLISPSNALCGEAQPENGTFFIPQVYERVRISLVEVNETVGEFVISVCNKVQKS